MTQEEVAAATGLTQAAISRLETGAAQRLDFRTLERLCRAFGIDPARWFEYRGPALAPPETPAPLTVRRALAELRAQRSALSPTAQREIDSSLKRLERRLRAFERRVRSARAK